MYLQTDGRTDGRISPPVESVPCALLSGALLSTVASGHCSHLYLALARSWVSQCERTMSTSVCYAGYANEDELSILINPKLSSKPMCLCIFFLELGTQPFLRGRVSTDRVRTVAGIFHCLSFRPVGPGPSLPPSLLPSVTGRLLPCLRLCLLRYLSRLDGRRPRPPVSFL